MCGICGLVSAAPIEPADLERMALRLAHRGPDAGGRAFLGPAALAHRRLSIIDLAGGQQPIANEDGSIHVVFNGEIYNYRELRRDLEKQGHRFRTASDTEVLVHLYEEHGTGCLSLLRGMFAFALWDARRQRLFAARDHFGQKPFYYTLRDGRFAFASEIKALLALDPKLAELDVAALDQYLALRVIAAPRSMFREVRKLPPAHFLLYDLSGGLRVQRYWELLYEPKHRGSDAELLDQLQSQLLDALRAHLVADVPVGAFLSGGLDSSLLVALLCGKLLDRPLRTFSASLPYASHDEAPYARMVAERFGTEHVEAPIAPSLIRLLPRLAAQLDEPSDPLCVCSYLIAQVAREHVKVVLGGDGGDELFAGYDRYYGNLYAGLYARVPERLRRGLLGPLLERVPARGWYKSRGHQLHWLHRLSFLGGGERYAASLNYFYFERERRGSLFSAGASEALRGFDPLAALARAYEEAPAEHPVDRMLCADTQLRLPDHSVMILDRMTMAHGLEARSPLLDHVLAEFCARLPVRLKLRGRRLRWAQHQLGARLLPPQVVERPKQGFSTALPYMLRDEYPVLFASFLRDSELARSGVLEQTAIDAQLAEHSAGRADHANRLWLLLHAEVWYRHFIRGQSVSELEARSAPHSDPVAPNLHRAR